VTLGVGILVIGAALYVVLAYPGDTERMLPREVPYPLVHYGLLALLIILVVSLVSNMRGMGDDR
jgi:hypothetical protein